MTQNGHVSAICYRLEVAGDVIYSENVNSIEGYARLNFRVASFSSFRDIYFKKHFVTAAEGESDDSIKRKHIRVSLKKLTSL